ncbi:hypothetical protein DFH09DRAFT_1293848 [Mycena vulgaris]|nr:hypothetical protein DFH09DRAFT_1293848 [Mycena vulgaris]
MAASNIGNGASSPSQPVKGSTFRPFKPSSSSNSDWLAPLIWNAKGLAAGAEILPFPHLKGIFGTVVFLLETVDKVKKNRDSMKELCGDAVEIITIIRDQISAHGDTAALSFKSQCEELEDFLKNVIHTIEELEKRARSLRGRIKEIAKSSSTTEEISRFRDRIREVRANFTLMINVDTLITTKDTNLQVQKMLTVISPDLLVPQMPPHTNNCPPPTRIFHGRQTILDKMNHYFTQSKGVQQIFLLHGLGGAGKTQISLKFIQESASHFTNIFLIDTSTVETIDAGLKTIATAKNVGSSPQDALQWLRSKADDWLLFFDNADDPKINLNDYFPQCTHGNILITSRNPGLCVYAASHYHVSDMEETDAMDLLLRSAALDITDHNKLTATRIVKVLCYLPLAIIQAGAFISRSGSLDSYLDLYEQNQTRLLSQKPTQAHDNYAWTVFTTWQISFDQLSQKAQTFLQLCSFLHYQGISEEIFKNATNFEFKPSGSSQEELRMPLEFLSQFLGPARIWDSLCFMDLTNEIQSYSLINYDSGKKMFSIHPLVHYWTRSTLSNDKLYHHCMIAIVGMGLARLPDEDMKLACLWMLPHIELLIQLSLDVTPDFRLQFGKIYMFAGKTEKANRLALTLVDDRRKLLGDDHSDTLEAICLLALTYDELGQFTNAEKLQAGVLQKQKTILSDNHPDTMQSMANLAAIYINLGKLQEAEGLLIVVLDMRREVLGDSHPETLRVIRELALVYEDLGKFQKAEEMQVVELDKWRAVLGHHHPETLTAMANLGLTYSHLGKLQEAEELEGMVLYMRRKILGNSHPDTLRAMANLAFTYHSLNKLKEAKDLEVVVLEMRRKILGNSHPDTLRTMANLGATYSWLGKLQEAEELEVVVLEMRRNTLGNDHLETLISMGNLAFIYRCLHKLKEAKDLEVVVLDKRRRILGDHHLHTLCAMRNLGSTLNMLGRYGEAEELLVVAFEKQMELFGNTHPDTVKTMKNLRVTYEKLGKFKEEEDLKKNLDESQT